MRWCSSLLIINRWKLLQSAGSVSGILEDQISACNKITDAGVCREHSGSTRILFQEVTNEQRGPIVLILKEETSASF